MAQEEVCGKRSTQKTHLGRKGWRKGQQGVLLQPGNCRGVGGGARPDLSG